MSPRSAAATATGTPPQDAGPTTAELVEVAPGQFRLQGDLGLAAVAQLVGDGSRLLPTPRPRGRRQRGQHPDAGTLPDGGATVAPDPAVTLDLGGIGRASSAAVALLLEWTDQVQRNGGRLVLTNWPTPLVRIADFSNVAGLLGISGDPATIAGPAFDTATDQPPPTAPLTTHG